MVDISSEATQAELEKNSSYVLTKRKKHFLEHLRGNIESIGFAWIAYMYLLDCSLFNLVLRCFFNQILAKPFPANLPENFLTVRRKHQLVKYLFCTSNFASVYIILTRILFEDYANKQYPSYLNGFVHGGFLVQIIGERVCKSKSWIIFNDLIIMVFQFLLFSLVFLEHIGIKEEIDFSNNQTQSTPNTPSNEALDNAQDGTSLNIDLVGPSATLLKEIPESNTEGDGYSGQVHLITIKSMQIVKLVIQLDPFNPDVPYDELTQYE